MTDLNKRKTLKILAGTLIFGGTIFCSACSIHTASVDRKKCRDCGICVYACPHGAIKRENGKIKISKTKCTGCGKCVKECSFDAIRI